MLLRQQVFDFERCKAMTYYRITLNSEHGMPLRTYPAEQWAEIALRSEDRGWEATLERQHVFDGDADLFMAGLVDTTGYVRLGDKVATPWQVIAEMRPRTALLIG